MKWFILGIKNYCKFDGRTSRAEFWWYYLFYAIFLFIFSFLDSFFAYQQLISGYGLICLSYIAFFALPTIGIQVRRLHDIGKSGWWILLLAIPIIGFFLYYLYAKKGDPFINKYGAPNNHINTKTDAYDNSDTESTSNTYDADQQNDFSQVMFCRQCGTQLDTSASFCHKCGTQVIKSNEHNTNS